MKHYLSYFYLFALSTPALAMELVNESDAFATAVELAKQYKQEAEDTNAKNTLLKAKLSEKLALEAYQQNEHKKAFEIFSPLEKHNTLPDLLKITSRYYLGALLFNGKEIDHDLSKAESFLKLTAEQNYIPTIAIQAQYTLAELYLHQNRGDQAIRCLKSVVSQAEGPVKIKACRQLGELFFYGKPGVIEANKNEACKYLEMIEDQKIDEEAKIFACQHLAINDYKSPLALKRFLTVIETTLPNYDKTLARYYIGLIHFEKGETKKAKKYLEKGINNADNAIKANIIEHLLKIADNDLKEAIELYNRKEYKKAKKSLKKIIANTDLINLDKTQAYYYLAQIYFNGEGSKQNCPKALSFYEKILEQKEHPKLLAVASCNIGKIYYFGLGANKNYHQAQAYFERAEIQHDTSTKILAARCLGEMYYKGLGLDQPDFAKAFTFFESAFNQTIDMESRHIARLNLAEMYYLGKGTPQNFAQAIEFFGYTEKNDTNSYRLAIAHFYLGKIWFHGNGVAADTKKGCEYFVKAASFRNNQHFSTLVSRYLANIYYYGIGAEQNYGLAEFELMKLANQVYDPEARAFAWYHLGMLCDTGKGSKIEEDKKDAIGYFEQAKNQKDNMTIKDLATRSLADKEYDAKNDVSAAKLYEAIDYDSYTIAHAACRLAHIECRKQAPAFEKALSFYKKSADQNVNKSAQSEAAIALSKMYEEGKGITKNADEALRYKNMSIKHEINN